MSPWFRYFTWWYEEGCLFSFPLWTKRWHRCVFQKPNPVSHARSSDGYGWYRIMRKDASPTLRTSFVNAIDDGVQMRANGWTVPRCIHWGPAALNLIGDFNSFTISYPVASNSGISGFWDVSEFLNWCGFHSVSGKFPWAFPIRRLSFRSCLAMGSCPITLARQHSLICSYIVHVRRMLCVLFWYSLQSFAETSAALFVGALSSVCELARRFCTSYRHDALHMLPIYFFMFLLIAFDFRHHHGGWRLFSMTVRATNSSA